MLEQKDGSILAGTDGNGIALIRNRKVVSHYKKTNGLSSEVVLRMVPDTDNGGIFVITSNSLCFMKKDQIRELKNFPYYNNSIWLREIRVRFLCSVQPVSML